MTPPVIADPPDDLNSPEDGNSTVQPSHQKFRTGVPAGRFNLIVNPERAQKYVKHRLFIVGIAMPLIGIGTALSWSGYVWAGLPMIVIGFLLPRVVKAHAAKILLYLALQDAKTCQEAVDYEILEVRLRWRGAQRALTAHSGWCRYSGQDMWPLPSRMPFLPIICQVVRWPTSRARNSSSSSVWLIALAGIRRGPSLGSASPQNDWW